MESSALCEKCGQVHFPLKTYRAWIKKYDGKMHSPYAKTQVLRWQAMIDDHEEIVLHNTSSKERNRFV